MKKVPKFPNYAITEEGRVYNTKHKRELIPVAGKNGSLYITLFQNNARSTMLLHRLVAEMYVKGRTKTKNRVLFIKKDKYNCHKDNLKWGTHQEACLEGETGQAAGARRENNGNSKLTSKDVEAIRNAHGKKTYAYLSEKYGVSKTTIYNIIFRKTWN